MPLDLPIERLFDGQPLLAPLGEGWESGVTFNSAAVLLKPTRENLPAIQALLPPGETPREIVALHYRARPRLDPGFRHTRSFVGLSIHEPDLTPIRRFERPVILPGGEGDADVNGVEDPRIARLDDGWWAVYCGVAPCDDPDPDKAWLGSVCVARSEDLVNWSKRGVATGLSGDGLHPHSNKDGVLFPDRIDGKVAMLHRPMVGDIGTWQTAIALAENPEGPYRDLGPVHGPARRPEYEKSWCGAGAVPIRIGEGRYVSIEHTGNFLPGKRRKYVLDAFLYDFNEWDPARPETLVKARIDDFMRPETDFEVRGPFRDSVGNVVFACGAYVHDGWLYLVYGGGDSFILAARLRFGDLVEALESRVARREAIGVL
jgi:predicted GH43/DUF377 family glycosyl hydrolase